MKVKVKGIISLKKKHVRFLITLQTEEIYTEKV